MHATLDGQPLAECSKGVTKTAELIYVWSFTLSYVSSSKENVSEPIYYASLSFVMAASIGLPSSELSSRELIVANH